MRWPEALNIITVLWDTLADDLKYNRHSGVTDRTFNDGIVVVTAGLREYGLKASFLY